MTAPLIPLAYCAAQMGPITKNLIFWGGIFRTGNAYKYPGAGISDFGAAGVAFVTTPAGSAIANHTVLQMRADPETPVTFEFVSSGSPSGGHIGISFTAGDTADQMAALLLAAVLANKPTWILSAGLRLNVDATVAIRANAGEPTAINGTDAWTGAGGGALPSGFGAVVWAGQRQANPGTTLVAPVPLHYGMYRFGIGFYQQPEIG